MASASAPIAATTVPFGAATRLITGSADQTAKLCNLSSAIHVKRIAKDPADQVGESALILKGPQGRINRAVWEPLKRTIISAGEDAVIRIWDSEKPRILLFKFSWDHEFAKLHLAQAEACPLVRPSAPTRVSRTVYLLELEEKSDFDLQDYVGDAGTFIHFHLRMNFAIFKIPLRNADQAIHAMRNRKGRTKRKPCIKLEPLDHKYMYVNSCNGLLFLAETFYNDPLVVCNPITGYSPKTNQYKVFRVFSQGTPNLVRMVELYTLGQRSWKSLGTAPTSAAYMLLTLPTYLNGELYWFYYESSYEIASFDFDNEQFHSVPTPPFELEECQHVSLGLLGGSLCVCYAHENCINVWVMEDYGTQKSWTNRFSIQTDDGVWWPNGLYEPMRYLKNGGLLMFNHCTVTLIYYHPRNYRSLIYLKLRGFSPYFEAISHVPSFISLKDILMGNDVEVLNINSRCAECKLPGETRGLDLVNLDADVASDDRSFKEFRMKQGFYRWQ
ncbi:F-box protein [Prunus yedoensis var. nudiflora]|uniref:F-box protein n=1 Tax=Prunus yedoensis var. nudiflora TaxID=2094558 RepID=A0A314USV0_PRUYE|nr:F-box protein [Prunus yedoensis var. nudiflora]